MKNMIIPRTQAPSGLGRMLGAASVLAWLALTTQTWAQVTQFLIESRAGGQNLAWYTTTPASWNNSSSKSTAPGCTTGIGSKFFTWPGGATNGIQPSIVLSPQGLVQNAEYMLEITHITGGSLCTNIVIEISAIGAALSTNRTHNFNTWAGRR